MTEAEAHDAYVEHAYRECMRCDVDSGWLCAAGQKLHRRWLLAQVAQA